MDEADTALKLEGAVARLLDELERSKTGQLTECAPPESPIDRPSPPALPLHADREFEIECYHKVNDGGWVPFSLDLLDQIIAAPEKHRDLLKPFALDPDLSSSDDWRAPSRILAKKQQFHMWQKVNRNISDEDEGYSAFLEEARLRMASTGGLRVTAQADFEKTTRAMWEQSKTAWRLEQENMREVQKGQSVDEYTRAAKIRLKQHGFTEAFQFLEGPKHQDKRTTWIERLAFEYWLFDGYKKTAEDARCQYDKARQALVDSKLLGPGETPDSLCTTGPEERRYAEELQAEDTAQAPGVLEYSTSPPSMTSDLAKLVTEPEASLEAAQRKKGLIERLYLSAQDNKKADKDMRRQNILIEWILDHGPPNGNVDLPAAATEGDAHSLGSTDRTSQSPDKVKKRRREDPDPQDMRVKDDTSSDSEHAPAAKRARAKYAPEGGQDEPESILATERSDAKDGKGNVSSPTESGSLFVCEQSLLGTNGCSDECPQTASLGDLPLEPLSTHILTSARQVEKVVPNGAFENMTLYSFIYEDGSRQFWMESTCGALMYCTTWIEGRPAFKATHTVRRAAEPHSIVARSHTLECESVW